MGRGRGRGRARPKPRAKTRRSKKTMTYHGRPGKPVIHTGARGSEYIMVRAAGGGTKRLYLTPEVRRKLESKEGYPRRGEG